MKWSVLSVATLLALSTTVFGATLSLQNGGSSTLDLQVGSLPTSIDLDVVMDTGSGLGGWDASLTTDAPGLSITAETLGAPFAASDWTVAGLFGVSPVSALRTDADIAADFNSTMPVDGVSLGYTSNSLGRLKPSAPDYPAATYTITTLTIGGIDNLAEGIYMFDLVGGLQSVGERYYSNASDAAGNPDFDAVNSFRLNIVPEPASLMLLAVGALFLRRRR